MAIRQVARQVLFGMDKLVGQAIACKSPTLDRIAQKAFPKTPSLGSQPELASAAVRSAVVHPMFTISNISFMTAAGGLNASSGPELKTLSNILAANLDNAKQCVEKLFQAQKNATQLFTASEAVNKQNRTILAVSTLLPTTSAVAAALIFRPAGDIPYWAWRLFSTGLVASFPALVINGLVGLGLGLLAYLPLSRKTGSVQLAEGNAAYQKALTDFHQLFENDQDKNGLAIAVKLHLTDTQISQLSAKLAPAQKDFLNQAPETIQKNVRQEYENDQVAFARALLAAEADGKNENVTAVKGLLTETQVTALNISLTADQASEPSAIELSTRLETGPEKASRLPAEFETISRATYSADGKGLTSAYANLASLRKMNIPPLPATDKDKLEAQLDALTNEIKGLSLALNLVVELVRNRNGFDKKEYYLLPTEGKTKKGGKTPLIPQASFIGSGAMGDVFKGFDPETGEWVAIKIIQDIDNSDRLEEEFRNQAKFDTLAVVRAHGFGLFKIGNASHPFIVMEYIDLPTLNDFVKGKDLSAKNKAVVVKNICEALQEVHLQGIAHRDLKPANIFIDPATLKVKIPDFGLAKDSAGMGKSATGVMAGTVLYMAPYLGVEYSSKGSKEREKEPDTFRAVLAKNDIYAVGVILYKLMTGTSLVWVDLNNNRTPHSLPTQVEFSAYQIAYQKYAAAKVRGDQETMARIKAEYTLNKNFTAGGVQSAIPDELHEIIAKMTALDPEETYEDIQLAKSELERYTAGQKLERTVNRIAPPQETKTAVTAPGGKGLPGVAIGAIAPPAEPTLDTDVATLDKDGAKQYLLDLIPLLYGGKVTAKELAAVAKSLHSIKSGFGDIADIRNLLKSLNSKLAEIITEGGK